MEITVCKAMTIKRPKKLRPWLAYANGQPIMLPMKSGGAQQLAVYAITEADAVARATKTYNYLTKKQT